MSALTERLTDALTDRYRIEGEIGRGGMASVYLARDLRHDRDVAIKVLHPDLGAALGGERFLSEIRTTARLQHPHILPLLDSGEADGLLYYVMPLATGETLRARLERERQLPIEDAIRIAREVADALGYAHTQRIIHRDIKPENILLQGGHALVADFGIALAVQSAGGERMTQTGLSLGTPQYMSPEQAMGERVIDARSDVYALGAVTYEMFTGEPPFTGNSVQAIVAKVMSERPVPLRTLRDTVPEAVESAVQTALAKLPADRFASAPEFATALATSARESKTGSRAAAVATTPHASSRWARSTMAFASVTGLAVAAALWGWLRPRHEAAAAKPVRVAITAPAHHEVVDGFQAFSPDGRFLVFAADSAGTTRLYLRSLDEFEARAIPGTEGVAAERPLTFSPDGEWVVFMADRLLKTRLRGTEPPQPVPGVLPFPRLFFAGASWGEDGSIVFVQDLAKGLMRVSAAGGTPELLTTPDYSAGEFVHAWPELIPGSRTVLYGILGQQGWRVVARSLEDQSQVTVVPGASIARFVDPGYLVYSKDTSLYAVRFDRRNLRTVGEPIVVASNLPSTSLLTGGHVFYAVSRHGDLSHLAGSHAKNWELELVDRRGNVRRLKEGTGTRPRFASVSSIIAEDAGQIWQYDLTRGGTRTRLTSGALRYVPIVSADGSRLVFSSYETGPAELYSSSLTAPGRSSRLLPGTNRRYASSWSSPGNRVSYIERGAATRNDIWVVTADSGGKPEAVVQTEFDEYHPRFSPDGRWLAYTSRRSGRPEVYVQAYPLVGSPIRVSSDGGQEPVWLASGRELYYRSGNRIMVCAVRSGATLGFGEPRPLLEVANFRSSDDIAFAYDVAPDGEWFVITTSAPTPRRELRLVLNWAAGTVIGR